MILPTPARKRCSHVLIRTLCLPPLGSTGFFPEIVRTGPAVFKTEKHCSVKGVCRNSEEVIVRKIIRHLIIMVVQIYKDFDLKFT